MKEKIPIVAVVLSAGKSTRMGRLKQLLPIQGTVMIERVLKKILSLPFSTIVPIVGYKHNEIMSTVTIKDTRFKWITNHHYHDGLSSSLKEAVKHVPSEMLGMMIFLGDQPLLKEKTIFQLLDKISEIAETSSNFIIQPSYNGQTGHPVFISLGMFPYIDHLSGDQGAKKIFPFAEKHILVPVDDKGVILDIDTPEDYKYILENLERYN